MEALDLPCADAEAMAQVFATLAAVLADPPTDQTFGRVAGMAAALGVACPQAAPLATLERDYADLFVVPNARYVAPYESVYRDPTERPPGAEAARAGAPARRGLLMGPSTLEVQRAQREAGLQPQRDLPDHVANELWFMAHLWRKEAAAADTERAAWAGRREHFADAHLRQWLGELTACVQRNQQCGVYGAALEIALAVLELD